MANDIVSQYSKRVPFRAYIFFLLEKHHIPLPPRDSTINTNEELWGYFIEMMYHRCVKKITYLPTNGYSVGDINTQLINKSFIFTAKYLNVFNNNQFTRDFTISTRGTASISGANHTVSLSVELRDKFYTDQDGVGGVVGSIDHYNTYNLPIISIMGSYGNPPDTPRVGSTVFHKNNYQTEIVSIDLGTNTFVARTMNTDCTDIWYYMSDTRNKLISHMGDYNNPHHVTLTQAESYQGTSPLVVNHNVYLYSNNSNNRFVTYAEALQIAASGGIGLAGKFHTSEYGLGSIGSVNTYNRSLAVPYVVGESLSVGDMIFHANRYQTVVTSVSSTTYQAQTVSTNSIDIAYLIWDMQTSINNLTTLYNNLNSNKMDKVPSAVVNNFANFVSGVNTKDSGYNASSLDPAGAAATVQSNLNTHTSANNPHNITLSIAEAAQGTSNLVLNHDVYRLTQIPNNRYITYQEGVNIASSIVLGTPQYMGQIKFGADNIGTMNTISNHFTMSINDLCIVESIVSPSTNSVYRWTGSNWSLTSLTVATLGQFYDIVFWFGTWVDGVVHYGDVSARITCEDSSTPEWDLIVYTDVVIDGSITTQKIADSAVTNVKLANMPAMTLKGNNTNSSAVPMDLTKAQLKTMLNFIEPSDVPSFQNVGDRTITISKNNVTIDSFTTNESGSIAKFINIPVPTVPNSSAIMKGDGVGNLIAATPGVDYLTTASLPTVNDAAIRVNSSTSSLTAPTTPTTFATANQSSATTLTLHKVAWTGNVSDLTGGTGLSHAYITNLYWNGTTGVVSITTNQAPTTRRMQTTSGSTIPGSWSANGTSFTFTPTTITQITTDEFITIIY
jgi:hypothetical protein